MTMKRNRWLAWAFVLVAGASPLAWNATCYPRSGVLDVYRESDDDYYYDDYYIYDEYYVYDDCYYDDCYYEEVIIY